jgi:fructokinase
MRKLTKIRRRKNRYLMSTNFLYGGIEGGGTKFICAVGTGPHDIVDEIRFPTTTPQQTLDRVCSFFTPFVRHARIKSIGLGSFGPLDVEPASPTYGYITTTPKPNWANTNILGILQTELGVPITMDMDVAASAMAEFKWGANQGLDLSQYLTVGTGIGGSYILNGKPLRGLVSLEMGHVRIPHNEKIDPFKGSCPYHGDCFEGLASGPAIQSRFDKRGETLADGDPYWELEAGYIAYAMANYIFTLPPERIVLGGGVMRKEFLYEKVRSRLYGILNKYLNHPLLTSQLDKYIVPPALGDRAGVLGAIALAMELDK